MEERGLPCFQAPTVRGRFHPEALFGNKTGFRFSKLKATWPKRKKSFKGNLNNKVDHTKKVRFVSKTHHREIAKETEF
jgi:hypothetical protein